MVKKVWAQLVKEKKLEANSVCLCFLLRNERGLDFIIGGGWVAKHNGWHTCFQNQLPWVRFQAFPIFSKIIDIAEVNQLHRLEESG